MNNITRNYKTSRHLPSDILHYIFSDAAEERELLDTSPTPVLGDTDFSLLTIDETRYRANIRMRISLVSVCKLWYSTGIGFLYKIIQITRHNQFVSLLEALEGTRLPLVEPNRRNEGLGRHVKCLLLHLNERVSSDGYIDGINTLLRECPALRVFCLDVDAHEQPVALLEVAGQTATSLRSLRVVCHNTVTGSLSFTLPLLTEIGSFKILQKLDLEILDVYPTFYEGTVSLPQLHSLRIAVMGVFTTYDIMAGLAKWTLPALSTLALILEAEHSRNSMTHLKSFIQAHGRGIITLIVKFGHSEETAERDPLYSVLGSCPAVQDVAFLFRRIDYRLPPTLHLNRVSFPVELEGNNPRKEVLRKSAKEPYVSPRKSLT